MRAHGVQGATGRPLAGRAPDPAPQVAGQGSRRPRRPEWPEPGRRRRGVGRGAGQQRGWGRRSRGSMTGGGPGLAEAVCGGRRRRTGRSGENRGAMEPGAVTNGDGGRGQQARVGRAQCAAGARWSCAGVGTAEVSARERGGAHGGGVGTRAVGSGRSDEVDRRRGRGGSDGKWRRVDDEARPRLHLGAA